MSILAPGIRAAIGSLLVVGGGACQVSSLVLIKKLLNDQDGVVVCNPVNHNGAPGFPVSDINTTQLEAITCIPR